MKGGYVDGFLLVVPKGKESDYKKMAELGREIWIKHGALDYKECIGDDLFPKGMGGGPSPLSFAVAAKAEETDTVWFSFIVFKSREHRNEVNAKVMSDPAMNDPKMAEMPMPMDMKRFYYGGFRVEVGA